MRLLRLIRIYGLRTGRNFWRLERRFAKQDIHVDFLLRDTVTEYRKRGWTRI